MSKETTTPVQDNSVNRAKMYQLALFPLNNGATNVYYVLILSNSCSYLILPWYVL